MTGCTQVFCLGEKQFPTSPVLCRVFCGFGPVRFISYYEDTAAVINKHGIRHLFPFDKQLLTSVTVTDVSVAKSNTEACDADVQAWCASRRLQLNPSKMEVIWLGTCYLQ